MSLFFISNCAIVLQDYYFISVYKQTTNKNYKKDGSIQLRIQVSNTLFSLSHSLKHVNKFLVYILKWIMSYGNFASLAAILPTPLDLYIPPKSKSTQSKYKLNFENLNPTMAKYKGEKIWAIPQPTRLWMLAPCQI